jgi:hypothetical protein
MRLYVLLAAMPLSMGIAVRAPDKDPDPSLTLVPKGDRKASFPPLSEPKYIQTRSLRAEEDAIFNFYDGINWQGNNTWSGAKSHMEDCVQVTMWVISAYLSS